MAKEVVARLKLQIEGGNATPSPPVGTALGQYRVPPMEFCKQFNERTKDMRGTIIPAIITIFKDRSFTFVTKRPPAVFMLKRAASMMDRYGARYLVTGEFVGQRPMTQTKPTLFHIDKISDLKGLIHRPLSAKVMPPTLP